MWLFAAEEAAAPGGIAPEWALAVAGAVAVLVPAGYGIGRLYRWWQKTRRDQAAEDQRVSSETVTAARRSAIAEAYEIVDRLTKQVAGHGDELRELREQGDERERKALDRAAKCEEEHAETRAECAGTRAMLKMLASQAKRRGIPLTKELERLIEEGGSGPHTPLPPE